MTQLPAPELARQGMQTRAERIGSGLSLLIGLYTLLALLSLGVLAALWAFSGSFWQELGAGSALPTWIFGLGFVLTALFYLPYLLALSAARRAILSLRDYVSSAGDFSMGRSGGRPDALSGDVKRFITWLGVWQWGTLASAVLGLGIVAASFGLSQVLLPDNGEMSLGGPETVLVLLSGLAQSVPTVVLTWLVLGSIKRFFAAALSHARGTPVPVTPAATAAGGWLIFSLVVLGLGLATLLLSALMVLVVAAVPGLGQAFEDNAAFGFSTAIFRGVMWGLAALLLLSGLLYGLLMTLAAWSRGFALDVAAVLDAGSGPTALNPATLNTSLGPWKTALRPPDQR
ncbi:hypothetical protein GCM10022631_19730 [Deinococcus rubellus]|uniref:DUF975 family protein n=1 Tax=Deinococcus rubellus TaxID=1889240 RepID=A0ABY5YFB5_9DEIO|nr:hypothetical protein [Deinococcus rubellus]UWX63767.1 hypothetical protein N0D28_13685 [Deinococcus rubellus]